MSSPLYTALASCCLLVLGVTADFYKHPPENEIDEAFRKHKIVPNVLDKSPRKYLFVKYRTPKSVYYVRLGTDLHPMRADDPPEDIIWEPEEGAYYTLLHLGPNVNGADKNLNEACFLHFAKVNIQGSNWQETGHLLAEYIGPRPFPEFGRLAYTYLLYKQPKLIDFPETKDIDDYQKFDWDLKAFLKKHNITELVAGNFYTSDADSSKFSSLLTIEPGDFDTVSPKML